MISSPAARKWLAMGTGVGAEIDGDRLTVAVVRVRPQSQTVLGSETFEGFKERPAAVWGAEVAAFLKQLGVVDRPMMVLLSPAESLSRTVALRGVAKKDIASALAFQMDGIHPYGEGEAASAWTPIGNTGDVLIGVSKHEVINRYASLFAEAGLPIAGFTTAPVAVRAALSLREHQIKDFLALGQHGSETFLYGENETAPLFWAVMDLAPERAASLARAQMRLPSDGENLDLHALLPGASLAGAAALIPACPWLTPNLNLLPEVLRTTRSPWMFVPTAVLAVLLAFTGIALAGFDKYSDSQLLSALDRETNKVAPQAQRAAQAEKDRFAAQARIDLLKNFKGRTKKDLDALMETTKLIAPPAWVSRLDLTRTTLAVSGEAQTAAELLKVFDTSQNFRSSEFIAPLSRSSQSQMDVFQIRAARKEPKP